LRRGLVNVPKVSIVLPNLNNYRFLVERLDSIVNQTLEDWELIIVDSFSDDGAWELIQRYAADEPRIKASQAPREGIYPGLNRCISQAVGEYVYIATSDDTMDPQCLATMVRGLDSHPNCDICHTPLRVIDEGGRTIEGVWRHYPVARFLGSLVDKPHMRLAPFDGVLHCAVATVYSSLTQILVRRTVFERVGLFRNDWGSEGDFEWGMRASLVCNTLYLPVEVATWRRYESQATAKLVLESEERFERLANMVIAALDSLQRHDPDLRRRMSYPLLLRPYQRLRLRAGVNRRKSRLRRLGYLARMSFKTPVAVLQYFLPPADPDGYLRGLLGRLGLGDHVVACGSEVVGGVPIHDRQG
jgi:glycosyltransferase involved in cell wall biosynthesis